MTAAVKSELDRIVNTLVETGIVTKIILFGSHARGDGTPDSDIDLCVLTSVEDRHPIDLMADFHMKLWDVRTRPLDLLAYNKDHFYTTAERPTSFEHEIAKEGVSIYG
jgi:predicted nucleotidyltransferase